MRASGNTYIIPSTLLMTGGYCAEHEFGVEPLRQRLGIQKAPSSIQDILLGRKLESDWPSSVEDYRITSAADRAQLLTFTFTVPRGAVQKEADSRYTFQKSTRAICKAYLDQVKSGSNRMPKLEIPVTVLTVGGKYIRGHAEEHLPGAKNLEQFANKLGKLDMHLFLPEVIATAVVERMGMGQLEQLVPDKDARTRFLSQGRGTSAWDSSEFMAVGVNKAAHDLEALYRKLLEGKAYLGLTAPQNPFDRQGLTLMTEDAITPEMREESVEKWKESRQLLARVRETGIFERLQQANKRFFALLPSVDEQNQLKFWLNPASQDKYNHGYFTVEELDLWAQDKGPILKSAPQAA